MSANGSLPAPGRNLTHFAWRVASAPDGRAVAAVAGFAGYVSLPTGAYTATLTVHDSGGGTASAARDFVVGASSNPAAPGGPNATAVAAISLPPPAVAASAGSGLTRVELDALGSAPAVGAEFTHILWAVVRLPGRAPAGSASGARSAVVLAPGSYQVRVWE